METKRKFYQSTCSCCSLSIEKFNPYDELSEEDEVWISFWARDGGNVLRFGDRIKYMWRMLIYGTLETETVMLPCEEANRLALDIKEMTKNE